VFLGVECVIYFPITQLPVPAAKVPNSVPVMFCGETWKPLLPVPVNVTVTVYAVFGVYPSAGTLVVKIPTV